MLRLAVFRTFVSYENWKFDNNLLCVNRNATSFFTGKSNKETTIRKKVIQLDESEIYPSLSLDTAKDNVREHTPKTPRKTPITDRE